MNKRRTAVGSIGLSIALILPGATAFADTGTYYDDGGVYSSEYYPDTTVDAESDGSEFSDSDYNNSNGSGPDTASEDSSAPDADDSASDPEYGYYPESDYYSESGPDAQYPDYSDPYFSYPPYLGYIYPDLGYEPQYFAPNSDDYAAIATADLTSITIHFETLGGSTVAPVILEELLYPPALPMNPTKLGYVFGGWMLVSGNSDIDQSNCLDLVGDFGPIWGVVDFPITMLIDGIYSFGVPSEPMCIAGEIRLFDTVFELAWGMSIPTNVNEVTFVALWTEPTQEICFYQGEALLGCADVPESYSIETLLTWWLANQTDFYELVIPTGFHLAGWQLKQTFLPISEIVAFSEAPVSVEPVFAPDVYKVVFDANGGTPTPPNQTIEFGATLILPGAPTREGYFFESWELFDFFRVNLTGLGIDAVIVDAAAEHGFILENGSVLNFKARWEPFYPSIEFWSHGSIRDYQSFEYGATGPINWPIPHVRDLFDFKGWAGPFVLQHGLSPRQCTNIGGLWNPGYLQFGCYLTSSWQEGDPIISDLIFDAIWEISDGVETTTVTFYSEGEVVEVLEVPVGYYLDWFDLPEIQRSGYHLVDWILLEIFEDFSAIDNENECIGELGHWDVNTSPACNPPLGAGFAYFNPIEGPISFAAVWWRDNMRVEKTPSATQVAPGGSITWELVISNGAIDSYINLLELFDDFGSQVFWDPATQSNRPPAVFTLNSVAQEGVEFGEIVCQVTGTFDERLECVEAEDYWITINAGGSITITYTTTIGEFVPSGVITNTAVALTPGASAGIAPLLFGGDTEIWDSVDIEVLGNDDGGEIIAPAVVAVNLDHELRLWNADQLGAAVTPDSAGLHQVTVGQPLALVVNAQAVCPAGVTHANFYTEFALDDPAFSHLDTLTVHPTAGGLVNVTVTDTAITIRFENVPCGQWIQKVIIGQYVSGSPHFLNYTVQVHAQGLERVLEQGSLALYVNRAATTSADTQVARLAHPATGTTLLVLVAGVITLAVGVVFVAKPTRKSRES